MAEIIVVASGKGGSGKSSFVTGVSRALAHHADKAEHPGRFGHVPIQHGPGDVWAQGPRHPDQGDGSADGCGGGIDGVCLHSNAFFFIGI